MHLLFVYGTLAPENLESARAEGWIEDAVRGRLYDLGPYPALVDHDDPGASWVEGFIREVSWDQLTGSLDSYEGVSEGLYCRVSAETRGGRRVWMYVYGPLLPPTAVGPIARWNSKKRVRLLAPPAAPKGDP